MDRLTRKLRDQKNAQQKRAARLAAMTAEERERHDAWQRSHQPGPKGARAAARQQRLVAKEIATALATPKQVGPEVTRIQAEIARLEALAAAIEQHDIFG
ncbi:hypothetical protein BJF92_14480 [Rhizobium rhizosphaerae]|uniref:Uncharacterized protein n=1 Tax=Xaviernesmea rhizosphaerae TaxID=1672749 RepID=A0A1Q9ACJ1_9HYPH|nr:hypothetical protein [Xaviernesmea rhizosphaerae]OLP52621.1 hypothetical protein BJF92_14480 [Xaviernesmea rhizosphaerae]